MWLEYTHRSQTADDMSISAGLLSICLSRWHFQPEAMTFLSHWYDLCTICSVLTPHSQCTNKHTWEPRLAKIKQKGRKALIDGAAELGWGLAGASKKLRWRTEVKRPPGARNSGKTGTRFLLLMASGYFSNNNLELCHLFIGYNLKLQEVIVLFS